jgi:ADP-heptose:LPS heptosyltransferase
MNAAILYLRRGDYRRGWPLYRARHHMLGAHPAMIWPDLSEWDGRPLSGRLRLVTEQGIGDAVMFLTLVEAVRARVGAVTLLVTARLKALVQRSFPDIQVVAPDTDRTVGSLPPADAWICAGDLPAALGLGLSSAVRPTPYLKADRRRSEALRDRLQRRHPGKRLVGITWTSQAEDGWRRTVPPALWQPIADLEDVTLVSLQYRADRPDVAAFGDRLEIDHGIEPFDDLDGLAALTAAMDVVVSPPNNTVHFAGALGLPCHVMLPVDPDWRWGKDDSYLRWYDAMVLHRQKRTGDWLPVVASVVQELRQTREPARPRSPD